MMLVRLGLIACVLTPGGSACAQRVARRWDAGEADRPPIPVAVGGYCAVTLRDRQQWQAGDAQFAAVFDGQLYRFTGERERAIFAAAPADYAPMLGGDCPVTLAESGKRVHGQLEFGVLQGVRLLFFASEEARQRFLHEPRRFSDADLATNGQCPVTHVDHGSEAPGIPETAVTHGGLRYLFASAYERSLFLRNPGRYDGLQGEAAAAENRPPLAKDAADPPPLIVSPWEHPQAHGEGESHVIEEGEDVVLGASPAMAGYCPVTIRRDGVWVRGRYEYRVDLHGVALLTAGPEEKAMVESDPATYVPACGGDCVVTLASTRERVRGSVFHALEYEGRLFLFADAERRAEFKAHPERYADLDLAAEGNCVVTQVDEQRETPGLPQVAAWHEGKLYRFAGVEQKARFLEKPEQYVVKDEVPTVEAKPLSGSVAIP